MRPSFTLYSRNKTLSLGKRTAIMGVVNATPDSFYDGGRYLDENAAVRHALQLIDEGADLLDIGGQSTRPGSEPVGIEEECRRVLPILKTLRSRSDVWISIDTYRSEVAKRCLEDGADLINDVSSFREDPAMPDIITQYKVPVICMHFLKSIHPMPAEPEYSDLFSEILDFFRETFRIAEQQDVQRDQMIVDPGIGFGKKLDHNLNIIRNLSFLKELGAPILVGPSRKSFIEKITGLPASERLEGTAAAAGVCVQQGAHILRVHDVRFFRRYCDVLDALL
ncbi:dihydropteroate synthase [bacterium]|nr:dihydropteroate synthase [bacterium]